jgi:hypothetical protein
MFQLQLSQLPQLQTGFSALLAGVLETTALCLEQRSYLCRVQTAYADPANRRMASWQRRRTQVSAQESSAATVASLCALELPKGTGPRR